MGIKATVAAADAAAQESVSAQATAGDVTAAPTSLVQVVGNGADHEANPLSPPSAEPPAKPPGPSQLANLRRPGCQQSCLLRSAQQAPGLSNAQQPQLLRKATAVFTLAAAPMQSKITGRKPCEGGSARGPQEGGSAPAGHRSCAGRGAGPNSGAKQA